MAVAVVDAGVLIGIADADDHTTISLWSSSVGWITATYRQAV
jgi:hypothetical protein